jgi:hypothetical protein
MPDDLAPYHRIVFALALALATTKVKTEADVVSSALLLRSRAITREFVNELGIIRRSAQTRLLALAAGAVAFAAATKPYTSEKHFSRFFERYLERLRERETGEHGPFGRVVAWYRTFARATIGEDLVADGKATKSVWEKLTSAVGGGRGTSTVTSDDWFMARVVYVGDRCVFLGFGGFFWGPWPTRKRVKDAAAIALDKYGEYKDVVADVVQMTTRG